MTSATAQSRMRKVSGRHWNATFDHLPVNLIDLEPIRLDMPARPGRLPVVGDASIRGRARGAGSDFVPACAVRSASRERAVLEPALDAVGRESTRERPAAPPAGGPQQRGDVELDPGRRGAGREHDGSRAG
jgi:hypothetical protein